MRPDNGPEFTSRRMIGWAEDSKIGLVNVQPGRPMRDGHVESFNGRLRDERLNTNWLRTLNDVRHIPANWRWEYSCDRPHGSLDCRTPQESGCRQAMRMWKAKNASDIRTAIAR